MQATDWFLQKSYRYNVVEYAARFGAASARHMILCQGFFSTAPESLDVNPGVDFKVIEDMMWHVAATDPAFAEVSPIDQ